MKIENKMKKLVAQAFQPVLEKIRLFSGNRENL